MNHENVLNALATGLCRIADALPRAELAAILYPTKRMLQAVAIMYAQIIRFLMRALEWFQESKLSHALHSLTRPVELRYDDLVGEISHSTGSINNLALASSQAEQRDMHLKIQGLKDTVEELKGVITGMPLWKSETGFMSSLISQDTFPATMPPCTRSDNFYQAFKLPRS